MTDVSATGSSLLVTASVTFPNGFTIDAFATDADPFSFADRQIAEMELDANGNPVTRSMLSPIELTVSLTPGSEAAANMQALFEANAPARGKRVNRDSISISQTLPNGSSATLSSGIITSGAGGAGASADGRIKSVSYVLKFAEVSTTRGGGFSFSL